MKLLGLHLLAYGPFTNVELDLLPEGVHVVYGKNEAGKSTALRAIAGLLYGIAKNTPDAHVHKMPDLRIAGSFGLPGGGSVYLVRRKGKDNTLLDREGRPVDEAVLARLLGGVSEEQFLTMFGLDHDSLRRGGEALLLGKGDVGESLFGAAVAGGEVHQVLRALRAEAEALFTPKAHTRPLNDAIKAFAEATRRTRDASMSPESMFEQEKHLAELRRERAQCEADRQRRKQERVKLQRACHAIPIVRKHGILLERRLGMGDVVFLPSDASAQRTEELRTLHDANQEIARLERLVLALGTRRPSLVVPESLADQEQAPLDLANRLAVHRKAAQDLPKIETEIENLEAQARDFLAKAGRGGELEQAEAWRIDAVAQATIKKLAFAKTTLVEKELQIERALEECRTAEALLAARRERAQPAPDVGALKKATVRAERAGPLDDRLAQARAQAVRLEKRTTAQRLALGLGALSLADACGLPVMSGETEARFARDFTALDRDEETLAKQAADVEAREEHLAREIQALELEGKVPTERELFASRAERDATWKTLRGGIGTAKGARADLLSSYENAVKTADDLGDRLRREAERVGKLATLLAERDTCADRLHVIREKRAALGKRREEQELAWRTQWQAVGVLPRAPVEMKSWLAGHAEIVRTADELRSIEAEVAVLASSLEGHRRAIATELEAAASPAPEDAPLGTLLDRAEEMIEVSERAAEQRRDLDRDVEESTARFETLRAEGRELAQARVRLDQAWGAAIAPLGMPESASTDDVILVLDLLAQMFHRLDLAAGLRRRSAGIARDAAAFATDVAKLAREHATDLVERPADEAARIILERFHRGQTQLVERRSIDRQLADATELLARQRERRTAAEVRIGQLLAAARVDSIEGLEMAEQRSSEARQLDRQLADVNAELLGLGLAADALPDEIRELDLDAATARLEEVEETLEQLHQHASVLDQRIGGHEGGQRELENPQARAAEAAVEAETALAKVRELAERYARVKVASVVLGREIERYRQKNQGPILARASSLFGRLTLGSFSGLRADFDDKDQTVLVGIRGDGRAASIEAMSDGTRDQLYLALYLATLERFAKHGDPMPLIVDDVLIHFDDDRARAALEVLGELAEHTQVLFFTHHARLVELAREAIPGPRLFVKELS